MEIIPGSNIANKVRNTKLPTTKGLMALFEVVSNSIHAIKEAKEKNLISDNGKITIKVYRNVGLLENEGDRFIDNSPIASIVVKDNGIGLNYENFKSFQETDSDHKIQIGGKGVGRFVCLKVFEKMKIQSVFKEKDTLKERKFVFANTPKGFDLYEDEPIQKGTIGTSVELCNIKTEFDKKFPRSLADIAKELVMHFQLYFIQKDVPEIVLENDGSSIVVNLNNLFEREFINDVNNKPFNVGEETFTLYLSKSYNNVQSHKIHFCAHNRSVIDEGLYKRIIDLGKTPIKQVGDDRDFYYQAFVVGGFLDKNVDTERVGFNFPKGDDEEGEDEEKQTEDVTLAKIRRAAVEAIEDLLSTYLNQVRTEKMEKYRPFVYDKMPQYRAILSKRENEVKKLQPNLSPEKLDIELYKIDAKWKQEVKEKGIELIDNKKDITNLDEFTNLYNTYLEDFNEVGMSELARYVVHRKSVLDLFDKLLELQKNGKFYNEDILHSLFFPIRTYSDEVPYEKQNLWMLDERLTYHTFLASDKTFGSNKDIEPAENPSDRADLIIFNDAFVFSAEKQKPFNSFTIVEFKKPQRDDYTDSENPITQVDNYIFDLLEGKVKNRSGRFIQIDRDTPFYIYIVCDITPSLKRIIDKRGELHPTPDGNGYFAYRNASYSAYIEILPFEKVMEDAKKRNRILFDKLGLPNN